MHQKKIKNKLIKAKTGVTNPKIPMMLCSKGLIFGITRLIPSPTAERILSSRNEYLKRALIMIVDYILPIFFSPDCSVHRFPRHEFFQEYDQWQLVGYESL